MRPLRLELEGFTSFRERLEVDFSGLDLFAITGPTGSGKSSLIDAIVFALYGQVPRVGDDYKQLISHGTDRLSVLYEFRVGGQSYRIARTSRRAGASQQRLERLRGALWEPLADRARDIRGRVEDLLGLDYDGFTRAVVLPQGQFDAFLRGEPKERRRMLVALLGLGIYDDMQKRANQKALAKRQEAEFIGQQLVRDFDDATEEALAARRVELAAAEAGAARAEVEVRTLAEGVALAQKVRAARLEAEALLRQVAEEEERERAAGEALAGAAETRKRLEAEQAAVERQMASLGFDGARLTALAAARPRAEQLASLEPQIEQLDAARRQAEKAREETARALAAAEAAAAAAQQAEAEARATLEAAQTARDEARHLHAALALRQRLRKGEPCPVCERPVAAVPAGEAPVLEGTEARAREAETEARKTMEALQARRMALERARSRAAEGERDLVRLAGQRRQIEDLATAARTGLSEAGFSDSDTADAPRLVSRIEKEWKALENARSAREQLEARLKQAEKDLGRLDAEVAAATARRGAARARLDELGVRRGAVVRALEDGAATLGALAGREGWRDLEALPTGRDEADAIEARREAAQRAVKELAGTVATLRATVRSIEQKLARVAELAARKAALEADSALLKTLADHLRADELVAWIQEEALARLAKDGSRHLARLSEGRYELRLGSGEGQAAARAEQDFFVVDHWNADGVRSVKTLSGGETFLASLSLSLALAESLAQLSAEGRAGDALESLFLDEGFGTLDAETLDTVVSALDALQGGERVVGIVTHVRELAERMPARLEVRRAGSTATATVV